MTDTFVSDLLEGRVAVVTGGASGIGMAMARTFLAHGANVAIISRNKEKIDSAVANLSACSGQAFGVVADVRNYDAVTEATNSIVKQLGQIDILVNNAAGLFVQPAEDISPNGFKSVVEIDLNGTFHCCKATFPYLKNSRFGGCIINIATEEALNGWPGAAHAGAAKAGVVSLTRTLALEWAQYGIRANALSPGPVSGTEGVSKLYEQHDRMETELSRIPLGRFATLNDIAQSALFLSSPAANFVTGINLVVDGGRARKRV